MLEAGINLLQEIGVWGVIQAAVVITVAAVLYKAFTRNA